MADSTIQWQDDLPLFREVAPVLTLLRDLVRSFRWCLVHRLRFERNSEDHAARGAEAGGGLDLGMELGSGVGEVASEGTADEFLRLQRRHANTTYRRVLEVVRPALVVLFLQLAELGVAHLRERALALRGFEGAGHLAVPDVAVPRG